MHSPRFVAIAASALALAACGSFGRKPAVQMSARDANVNTRWHATITSPASLAGAVQMTGSASMTPGSNSGNTLVALNIANAAPGGVHPWQLHRGQCGADEGVFGPAGAYKAIKVGREGRAAGAVTVPLEMPTGGNYFVSVSASAANA